jgi:hypothetical protein
MATEPVIAPTTIDTITAFSGWPHCNNARHPRTVAPRRQADNLEQTKNKRWERF